jgi:hypothetical protein
MIALKIGNSIYHFVPLDEMRDKAKLSITPKALSAPWFGTSHLATNLSCLINLPPSKWCRICLRFWCPGMSWSSR